ncbi:hypothetical protein ABPG75_005373 [Micractinium tetrahymenae]
MENAKCCLAGIQVKRRSANDKSIPLHQNDAPPAEGRPSSAGAAPSVPCAAAGPEVCVCSAPSGSHPAAPALAMAAPVSLSADTGTHDDGAGKAAGTVTQRSAGQAENAMLFPLPACVPDGSDSAWNSETPPQCQQNDQAKQGSHLQQAGAPLPQAQHLRCLRRAP